MYTLPDDLLHLAADVFVSADTLAQEHKDQIIALLTEKIVTDMIGSIVERCLEHRNIPGFGQLLHMDVFVLTDEELNAIVKAAQMGVFDSVKGGKH